MGDLKADVVEGAYDFAVLAVVLGDLIEAKQIETIVETVRSVAGEIARDELPDTTLANVLRYGIGL